MHSSDFPPCSATVRLPAIALVLTITSLGVAGCRDRSTVESPDATDDLDNLGQAQPTPSGVTDEVGVAVVREITDAGITDAVARQLLLDHLTPAQAVVVATRDGIVELTGSVDNLLAKRRATHLAEVVRGVRAVSNRITVTTKAVPDTELVDNVHNALLFDPVTMDKKLTVSAKDGTVTLMGSLPSWGEKQIATNIAESVAGVSAVTNQIEVRYETERSDVDISREIERRLETDALVEHDRIGVEVDHGTVSLTGAVGSAAERTRAESLAWTSGVDSVSTKGLEVDVNLDDPNLRKRGFVLESDTEIADAVRDAMFFDPRVASFEISPVVYASTVTLKGTVDNLKAKQVAEQLAHDTVGVALVINEIEVKPGKGISDKDAAEQIRAQLLTDVYTSPFNLQVEVEDGTASLIGTVDNYFEKAEAGDLASRAPGVTNVNNLLQVSNTEYGFFYDPYLSLFHPYVEFWEVYTPPTTTQSDEQLYESIVDQMFWSPFVDVDQVHVSVAGGTATLTGTVDSWRERDAATENAYEGGALFVNNLLHVER